MYDCAVATQYETFFNSVGTRRKRRYDDLVLQHTPTTEHRTNITLAYFSTTTYLSQIRSVPLVLLPIARWHSWRDSGMRRGTWEDVSARKPLVPPQGSPESMLAWQLAPQSGCRRVPVVDYHRYRWLEQIESQIDAVSCLVQDLWQRERGLQVFS